MLMLGLQWHGVGHGTMLTTTGSFGGSASELEHHRVECGGHCSDDGEFGDEVLPMLGR